MIFSDNDYSNESCIPLKKFTGSYDKHNEPLYDGDILKLNDFNVQIYYEDSICNKWLVCGGFLSGDALEYYASKGEKVGNVKYNPELLNDGMIAYYEKMQNE